MLKKTINTKQVGNLFDVNESTVRRWAMSGKIKCTTSAGGHRKFSYKDIIDFSKRNKIYLKSVEDLSVIDNSKIVNKILNFLMNNDVGSIDKILIKLYLNGLSLPEIMDEYIEVVLVSLQKRLDDQKISVAQEHISRKIISKSLNNFREYISNSNNIINGNILCLNLENDIPDLPIDMIQILLESLDYTVHNCGSNTSIHNLKILLSDNTYDAIFIYLCDRQCCSATVRDNITKTINDLQAISDLAKKYKIKLFLGGPSSKNIDSKVISHYTTFITYSDVIKLCKTI